MPAVFSATQATFALRAGARCARAARRAPRSGGIGWPGQPSISVAPAAWQSTKACGADPWTSPSVTPEYIGWTSEPCPSTKRSLPPRRAPSTTSHSAAPGEEVGDDRVDRDAPPGDRDARLARRDEDRLEPAPARLEVELDRDRLLPDRAVGADREDDRRVHPEVRPRRDVEALRRLAQVAERRRRALARARAARDRRRGTRGGRSRRRARRRCSLSGARARRAGSARPASRRRRPPRSARMRARRRPSRRSGSPRARLPPARSRGSRRRGRARSE